MLSRLTLTPTAACMQKRVLLLYHHSPGTPFLSADPANLSPSTISVFPSGHSPLLCVSHWSTETLSTRGQQWQEWTE